MKNIIATIFKRTLLFVVFLMLGHSLDAQLIISEYLEGSSNDKCIEIYNTTGASINLSGYNLKLYYNGSTSSTTINLSGTINSCDVFVICNSSASQTSIADQTSVSLSFNGDDAVGLYYGTTLLDLFGTIGEDPGTEWTGVSPGTEDGNFIRNANYCSGNTSSSSGFPSFTSSNWTSTGNITGTTTLGTHTSSCGACGSTNTITTGTITGSPFSVDCGGSATGSVSYTSSGTFNTGNTFAVQLSNSSGSFSSPTTIGTSTALTAAATNPSGAINFSIPAGTVSGTGYRLRIIASSPSVTSDTSATFTVNYTPCSITTGTVSTSPFAVDCSTGSTGTVTFTSVGTYASGNSYTAQLSNASGSFSSPVNIGTLSSSANSGTINITIPAGTASGTGYLIRVISSSNSIVGSSSVAITITLSGGPCVLEPPHVTSIIYDGCNATGCDEGQSEIVFGNTGDYSLNVSSSTIEINYPGSPLYNLTGTIINNTSTTSAINTAANCSGLFVDGYNQTLPPNSAFLIVPSAICLDVLTWSDLCGTGPIYIIYGQSGTSGNTWHTGGNFANTGGARTFEVVFTTTDATVHTVNYTYTAPGSGANGNYATWTSIGGNAVTQGNFPNCHLTPVVLPTGLSYFKGYNDEQQNVLVWETESEQNNSHFTVFHSVDGFEYELMATVSGAGNSSEKLDYQLIDEQPRPGVNYYKLFSTDFDGTTYYKGIVAIEVDLNTVYYNQFTKSVELPEKENVEIYSPEGKLMTVSSDTNSIPFNHSGVFLVRFLHTGKTVRIFIP